MDQQLARLRRSFARDPADPSVRARYAAQLQRIYGAAALDLLYDRERWTGAASEEQDAAIMLVEQRLGPDYEWLYTRRYECLDQRYRIASFRHRASAVVLNLVPGGRSVMGSERGVERERPVHTIQVSPFLIGRMPVLQHEWDLIGGDDRRPRRFTDPQLPICGLHCHSARSWATKAGRGLRLPLEREWEYACRAGTESDYFWGDRFDTRYCWARQNSARRPHAPEEHEGRWNAFGLIDMAGNIAEWCNDLFKSYLTGRLAMEDRPYRFHPCRGGNWSGAAITCRSAYRQPGLPRKRYPKCGLRLALSLPDGANKRAKRLACPPEHGSG